MFGPLVRDEGGVPTVPGIGACRSELARLAFILAAVANLLALPTAIHAEVDAAKLYGQHCMKCHGDDGSGKAARAIEPSIPNFTAADWQAKRPDKGLLDSILDGKGETMPPYRKKVTEEEARALVSHVRAFAPVKKNAIPKKADGLASDEFEQRFCQLKAELEELQRQFRQLSEGSSVDKLPFH
jgi:mono/diheme cytochrome c family protein